MGLFRRKREQDEPEERCPQCGEPVPDGAPACMMCGADLRPLRQVQSGNGVDAVEAGSPSR
jgi:hypothetical protein